MVGVTNRVIARPHFLQESTGALEKGAMAAKGELLSSCEKEAKLASTLLKQTPKGSTHFMSPWGPKRLLLNGSLPPLTRPRIRAHLLEPIQVCVCVFFG